MDVPTTPGALGHVGERKERVGTGQFRANHQKWEEVGKELTATTVAFRALLRR